MLLFLLFAGGSSMFSMFSRDGGGCCIGILIRLTGLVDDIVLVVLVVLATVAAVFGVIVRGDNLGKL